MERIWAIQAELLTSAHDDDDDDDIRISSPVVPQYRDMKVPL